MTTLQSISEPYNIGYRKFIKVKCLCGQILQVDFYQFKSGKKNNCGCITRIEKQKQMLKNRKDNSINIDKNRLKELYCDKRLSTIQISQIFKCHRKTILVKLHEFNLYDNESKKPGKTNIRWKGYKNIGISYFNNIKRGAKSRNIEFNITIEYINNLIENQNFECSLTGIKIIPPTTRLDESTASLDRIDSTKGYVEGNVQWVHVIINFMKLRLTQQEFIDWCKKVAFNNPSF